MHKSTLITCDIDLNRLEPLKLCMIVVIMNSNCHTLYRNDEIMHISAVNAVPKSHMNEQPTTLCTHAVLFRKIRNKSPIVSSTLHNFRFRWQSVHNSQNNGWYGEQITHVQGCELYIATGG